VTDEAVLQALRDLQSSLDRLHQEMRAKDAEIVRLRESLAERDARIRGLGEQALHLLDLLHEERARSAPGAPPKP
jgi:hypothetical protein